MNVVIVGNHDLDISRDIASKIAAYLVVLKEENEREVATWGNENRVSVRAPQEGSRPSSSVEGLALALSMQIGLDCQWSRPLGPGRAAVFDRDYALVEEAHRVVAFFRCDRVMEGGTGHVVHAALVKGVPVEAWVLNEHGTLEIIGSDDGFEVDYEGSKWMQLRYLEWRAKDVEDGLATGIWKTVLTTATPTKVYTTSTGSGTTTTVPYTGWAIDPSTTFTIKYLTTSSSTSRS